MRTRQAVNPFLPSYEYIPDGEPHVFGDRVYLYGSHDKFNGISFCRGDYVCWSASVDDLSAWDYEGVIYRRRQDPKAPLFSLVNTLYAPDVARGTDGKFYLYYTLGYTSRIGVAVCDKPAGQYRFLGYVRYPDGTLLGAKGEPMQFDPAVFVDDDGQAYLYSGFAPEKYPKFLLQGHAPAEKGAMVMKLAPDMLTVNGDIRYICATVKNSAGTGFEGHEFFEAPSMRKFNGRYYFIYSSVQGHELCYAVSNKPTELCRMIFRHFGLDAFFCEIIGGSSGFPLKPAPEALFHILKESGSDASLSWFCGDNHTDMNAARNGGMRSAYAAYGFGTLGDAEYDLKLNCFSELVDHLVPRDGRAG